MRNALAALILISCILQALYGEAEDGVVRPGEYSHRLVLAEGGYTLYWTIRDGSAHFAIVAKTSGWVALGIDPEQGMQGADMIIGWVEGGSRTIVLDCFATGPNGPHPRDEELGGSQDLAATGGRELEGSTVIEFARPLATGDRYDKPIPDQPETLKILWAYASNDGFGAYHAVRGAALLSADQPAFSAALTPKFGFSGSYGLLLPVHAALMAASFLCLFIGMFFPRYLKRRKWWLKIHRRLGISGASLGLAGAGASVYMIASAAAMHLRALHSIFGAVVLAALLVTPIWGSLMLKNRSHPKLMRAVHRWLGRATLAVMLATIVLGLFRAGIFRV